MLRVAVAAATVCVVCAGAAFAKPRATLHYKVVALSTTTRLDYRGTSSDETQRIAGTASLSTHKATGKRVLASGSLTQSGGRVFASYVGTLSERATVGVRPGPTLPYVEQTCRSSKARRGTARITFARRSGNRVQASWALPLAAPSYCPGPAGVGPSVRAKFARIHGAARFAGKRVTLTLSGTSPFARGTFTGTYSWRATIVLART
jgi:hypothetical protein